MTIGPGSYGEPGLIKPCNGALGMLSGVTGRTLGDQTFPSSGDRIGTDDSGGTVLPAILFS
jgi:hypothetical protein